MRFEIAGQGLSIDPSLDWRPLGRSDDHEVHGAYLHNEALDVEAHVRGGDDPSARARDARDMMELVREQGWPPPAFDEVHAAEAGLTWAAATWAAPPWIVREYFVTDGRSVANFALIGRSREAVSTAIPHIEQLMRTLRFVGRQ